MNVRLDHVNISVRNLEESISWYQRLFGFEKVEEGIGALGGPWATVAVNDSMIALSEYPEWKTASASGTRAHRIAHFGLRVEDEILWRQKVKENQINIKYGGEVDYPFSKSWYLEDPSGHEIEVSWSPHQPLQFAVRV